jgi:hypothetical protein
MLAAAVAALLGLGERLQVIAVCGRNEARHRRLESLGATGPRPVPLDFVDLMPELMAAADVVVTDASAHADLRRASTGKSRTATPAARRVVDLAWVHRSSNGMMLARIMRKAL